MRSLRDEFHLGNFRLHGRSYGAVRTNKVGVNGVPKQI